jgi:hypothetical protein
VNEIGKEESKKEGR